MLLHFELHSDVTAMVHIELEGMEKEAAMAHFQSLFRICLKGHK
jgi:hypothetical protein